MKILLMPIILFAAFALVGTYLPLLLYGPFSAILIGAIWTGTFFDREAGPAIALTFGGLVVTSLILWYPAMLLVAPVRQMMIVWHRTRPLYRAFEQRFAPAWRDDIGPPLSRRKLIVLCSGMAVLGLFIWLIEGPQPVTPMNGHDATVAVTSQIRNLSYTAMAVARKPGEESSRRLFESYLANLPGLIREMRPYDPPLLAKMARTQEAEMIEFLQTQNVPVPPAPGRPASWRALFDEINRQGGI